MPNADPRCCGQTSPDIAHDLSSFFTTHLLARPHRRMELRPLPSQDEDEKREDDLKAAFAGRERDHNEIEKLFKRVAEQLVTMPKISAEHELTKE